MAKKEIFFFIYGLLAGAALFALGFSLLKPASKQSKPEYEFLPVYVINPQARNIVNPDKLYYVKIPNSSPLLFRVQMLADTLARIQFGGRPITVMEIEKRQGKKIALINLHDAVPPTSTNCTWYEAFQGSAGGVATEITLTKSFLQEDYHGQWIDGVEFLYNGEPFSRDQWDHIDLSGTYMR